MITKSLKNKSEEYERIRDRNIIQKEYDTLNLLHQNKKISSFLPEVVSYDKKTNELKLKKVPGNSINDIIKNKDQRINEILFLAGKNLRIMHNELKKRPANKEDIENIKKEIKAYLKNWDDFNLSKKTIIKLNKKIEELSQKLELSNIKYTGIHDDFSPPNIISDNKNVYFVDLAGFKYDLNYKDITELILCMKMYAKSPFFTNKKADYLISNFIKGYQETNNLNLRFFKIYKCIYFMDIYMKNFQFYSKLSIKYINLKLILRVLKKELKKELR